MRSSLLRLVQAVIERIDHAELVLFSEIQGNMDPATTVIENFQQKVHIDLSNSCDSHLVSCPRTVSQPLINIGQMYHLVIERFI